MDARISFMASVVNCDISMRHLNIVFSGFVSKEK